MFVTVLVPLRVYSPTTLERRLSGTWVPPGPITILSTVEKIYGCLNPETTELRSPDRQAQMNDNFRLIYSEGNCQLCCDLWTKN